MKKVILTLSLLVNIVLGYDGVEKLYTFIGVQNGLISKNMEEINWNALQT